MSHPHPELTAPDALIEGGLRVIPLGGLGEIGRNMTVFEHADRLLIVDCGVLFPAEDSPGVDLILPDFRAIAGDIAEAGVPLTSAPDSHLATARVAHADANAAYIAPTTHTSTGTVHQ